VTCLPQIFRRLCLACVILGLISVRVDAQFKLRQPESVDRRGNAETAADGGPSQPLQLTAEAIARSSTPRGSVSPADTRDAEYQQLAEEAESLQRLTRVLSRVVELSTPSVVHIESQHTEPGNYGRQQEVEEAGSGIIVEMSGQYHVITNRHVVAGAQLSDIRLQLSDGRTLRPVHVAEDPGTDVAVVTVAEGNLVPARLGDSRQIEIGDIVLAMGSPFGLSHSVTFGIVSAKGRRDLELGREVEYKDFIQTDAAINPGNSGGPLLDIRGGVIGLNTAIASSSGGNEGIGFAIPINIVAMIAEQLIRDGQVAHAYLGVTLDQSFDADAASEFGVGELRGALVKSVTPGSPAELARLRARDVILQFDGNPVESDSHLVNLVGLTAPGRPVTLEVLRGTERLTISITLQDRREFESR